MQNCIGRSLCFYGDAGWGRLVREGKYRDGYFRRLGRSKCRIDSAPLDSSSVSKLVDSDPIAPRHPILVNDFTNRLALKLGIPFLPVLVRTGEPPEQKTMQNSSMQARNVIGTLSVDGNVPCEPVLLVDDIMDLWAGPHHGWLFIAQPRQQRSISIHHCPGIC